MYDTNKVVSQQGAGVLRITLLNNLKLVNIWHGMYLSLNTWSSKPKSLWSLQSADSGLKKKPKKTEF